MSELTTIACNPQPRQLEQPRNRDLVSANLEPVLPDGLRLTDAGGTFKKTFAASRSFSPAAIWVLREIFSFPRFEKIFERHFRRDLDRIGVNSKPTL
jgi:hypothetical protein